MLERRRMLEPAEWGRLWWGLIRGEGLVNGGRRVREGAGLSRGQWRAWRHLAGLALMGECGLRVSEARFVCWRHVAAVLDGAAEFSLPSSVAKGGSERLVTATPAGVWALAWWYMVLGEVGVVDWAWHVVGGPGYGNAYTARGLQRVVQRLGLLYLGVRITPQTLRRTYGDRCRRAGDVRLAQLMLGHRRLSSTERYLGGSTAERRVVAARISGDLFPVGPPGLSLGPWGVQAMPWPRRA